MAQASMTQAEAMSGAPRIGQEVNRGMARPASKPG
jgi:hypothetical protein